MFAVGLIGSSVFHCLRSNKVVHAKTLAGDTSRYLSNGLNLILTADDRSENFYYNTDLLVIHEVQEI
jgi:hypothetical protein